MRRDICLFYQRDVKEVFDAYISAARDRFDKECDAKPYYSLTFGLNFSFKYNMNGGACTVHFMPVNGGTAVNVRYSVAQGVGARYEAHNRDLTKVVESRLGCASQKADIDVQEFLKPENHVAAKSSTVFNGSTGRSGSACEDPAPWVGVAPEPSAIVGGQSPMDNTYSASANTQNGLCTNCGNELSANARFCTFCGKQVAATPRFCSQCGHPFSENDRFCSNCGNKLK